MALGEPMEREVMSAPGAWILCGMLQDVNIRGTAADVWASGFQHPSGGKTGTSNDYRDAWYIGFTKRYTVGVWVGTDDHASMGSGHSGADDALPIWLDIMRGLHKGKKPEPFPRPKGVGDVTVCQRTGRIPQAFCDSLAYDYRVAAVGKTIPPCTPEIHDAAVARAERLAEEKARKAEEEAERLEKEAEAAADREAGRNQGVIKEMGRQSGVMLKGIWKKLKVW